MLIVVMLIKKKRCSDYSEENTCDNEVFCSTILHHRKKLRISTLQLPIYYIQYENSKSQLVQIRTLQIRSERNRLYLLKDGCIALAKIREGERSISPFSFYGHPHDYQSQVFALSTQQTSSFFPGVAERNKEAG